MVVAVVLIPLMVLAGWLVVDAGHRRHLPHARAARALAAARSVPPVSAPSTPRPAITTGPAVTVRTRPDDGLAAAAS